MVVGRWREGNGMLTEMNWEDGFSPLTTGELMFDSSA